MSLIKPSDRKLSDVARHVKVPGGVVSTGFPAVESRLTEWGIAFDAWQTGLGQLCLGKRENGEYACTVGGITLSIPRQVAKTFFVSRLVFALCTIFPDMTVLWTAHHTRTTTKTFDTLRGFALSRPVAPHVERIRSANGEQEIHFTNGSVIMFGAREQGFGRGFDEVDIEVFDEAQILTEKALEDMVAATNQSRFPAGALLFFMGTPPRPNDPGEAFTIRRAEALADDAPDGLYVEMSADPECGQPDGPDLMDWGQIRKANPSYPHRTPKRSILRLRKNLPGDDSWRREALGIWDQAVSVQPEIRNGQWSRLEDSLPEGRKVFGVKFSVDGALVGLAGAVRPDDGPIGVSGVRLASTAEGLGWLVDYLVARKDEVAQVVIDGRSGAQGLVDSLISAGIPARVKVRPESRPIRIPTLAEYEAAHVLLLQAVREEALFHDGGEALTQQISRAIKRPIGKTGGWGWQGISGEDDVTLLDAATLAFWGAKTTKRDPARKQRSVVMA